MSYEIMMRFFEVSAQYRTSDLVCQKISLGHSRQTVASLKNVTEVVELKVTRAHKKMLSRVVVYGVSREESGWRQF
jgi:hypothetical protein